MTDRSSQTQAAAPTPIAQWFNQWTEQQRQWVQGLQAATLPHEPLATAAWQPLPSMADALLGRIETGPTLAPLWDFDRKAASVTAAWWRLQQANQQYRQLVERVWSTVQQAVLKRRSEASDNKPGTAGPGAARPNSARAATDLWLEELNRCLLELMRTPQYLKAQRDTLDAGLALHEKLGEIANELCELLHLPSRSEVDDLARTVTELRRELRSALRAPAPQPAPEPAPQPAPKPAPASPRAKPRKAA